LAAIKGVFVEGREYRTGDGVSLGGSFWIAQLDNPAGRPGTSDAWRLAVKRGRDGKDGLPGKDGERGPEGPRGKDLTQIAFDGGKH